jgi:hypothetical protein
MGAVVFALAWSTASFAQETTVVAEPPAPATVAPAPETTTTAYRGPNRVLIGVGLGVFAAAYLPAVIVAGTSGLDADRHLFIPVVGPWVDLGNRPACGVASVACDKETTNKVLIAVSGVFQGLGVFTTIAGFLMPERQVVTTTAKAEKPTIHVSPTEMGAGGAGVTAFGTW